VAKAIRAVAARRYPPDEVFGLLAVERLRILLWKQVNGLPALL
jgi:hypothetical protein